MARARYNNQIITGHWVCLYDEYIFVQDNGNTIPIEKLDSYDTEPSLRYNHWLQDLMRKTFDDQPTSDKTTNKE